MRKLLFLLALLPLFAMSQTCNDIPELVRFADELVSKGQITDAINMLTEVSNESRLNNCRNRYLVTNKLNELRQRQRGSASNRVSTGSDITVTANGVRFTMKWVKGGTFQMGATSEQGSDADSDEKPAHSVTVSDFWIGETEVTQALWQAVMGNNPSRFHGSNRPVEQVSWNDCQTFVNKLNSLLSGQLPAGRKFRLPTEAEWEYAARGGNRSGHYKYSGSNNLGSVAWYDGNSGNTTHDVKTKNSNELGIYDMSGNVWEWCQDWYDSSYYGNSPRTNPTGPSSASDRVSRGGGWGSNAVCCRVSYRGRGDPTDANYYLGLRLAL